MSLFKLMHGTRAVRSRAHTLKSNYVWTDDGAKGAAATLNCVRCMREERTSKHPQSMRINLTCAIARRNLFEYNPTT